MLSWDAELCLPLGCENVWNPWTAAEWDAWLANTKETLHDRFVRGGERLKILAPDVEKAAQAIIVCFLCYFSGATMAQLSAFIKAQCGELTTVTGIPDPGLFQVSPAAFASGQVSVYM